MTSFWDAVRLTGVSLARVADVGCGARSHVAWRAWHQIDVEAVVSIDWNTEILARHRADFVRRQGAGRFPQEWLATDVRTDASGLAGRLALVHGTPPRRTEEGRLVKPRDVVEFGLLLDDCCRGTPTAFAFYLVVEACDGLVSAARQRGMWAERVECTPIDPESVPAGQAVVLAA